jgi:hypothetical protein
MSANQSMPRSFRGEDLTGRRFGRWLVLAHHGWAQGAQPTTWLCRCDCGVERPVPTARLNNGMSRSCGCIKTVHGNAHTREYKIYKGMIQRCENPRNPNYKDYGRRGIFICSRWRESFETFLADVGLAPSTRHTIDRFPDPDGPYSPDNTRWATPKEQANNRRRCIVLEYAGERHTVAEWAEIKGVSWAVLHERLDRGWSVAEAIDTPLRTLNDKRRPRKSGLILEHKGERLSIAQWARRIGINVSTLKTRLHRDGWSVAETLDTPLHTPKDKRRSRKTALVIEYNGERLTIAQWATKMGLNAGALRTRLNRDGWSVADALNTPTGLYRRKV